MLDGRGRLLQMVEGDGTSTTTYQRNAAGLVTQTVDPMNRPTFDIYNSSGDLLQETAADGSWTQFAYDPTFHNVTSTLNILGETTSNTYDPLTGDLLTSTDATGAVTSYVYYQTNGKSNGLVYSVTTPTEAGTATNYNYYDAARRLVESFDDLGVPTYYAYDANGNPFTTTDVYGRVTKTVYDAKNQLVQSVDAMGGVTSDTYNPDGEQASERNARGFTSTTSYDARGWVSSQTDAMGVTTETDQYDGAGNLIKRTDANGNATNYAYNADDELTQTTYADNSTSSEIYDADGEVISSTDQLGRTSTDSYNAVGEQVASTDPMGRTMRTLYDAVGNAIRTTDAMGLSSLSFFDADNRVVATAQQVSGGVFQTSANVYDKAGEVVETIDALGHKTFENFNADGESVGTTDADGFTSGNVYDLVGNLIQSTDSRGKVTNYYYNANNEQIATVDSDGNRTQTVYDALGNVIQTIDSKGTTTTTFDADNRVVASKDADGNVSQLFYDLNGNTIESIDPNGKITRDWYNTLNEQVLSEDPNGHFSQSLYNPVGDVTASIDSAGNVTQNGYNADDQRTSTRDGNGNLTQFGFNADGQTISETDAVGNTTSYVLNGVGDVVATVDPLGNVTASQYDLNNQLVSTTDANGRTITEQYDNDGRLTKETWFNADGSVQDTKTYTYDQNGNLLTASNGYGTYTMTYDNNGNLQTRTDPFGITLTYGYDGNSNVTSVQDSRGGTLTNVFDSANRLVSKQFTNGVSQARLDLTYTQDGQLATMTRYKDLAGTQLVSKTGMSYDAAGNTTEIKHTNAVGGVLGDYQYAFDTANRLSSETDTQNGGAPVTTPYAYDKASQLTQAGSNGYSYDQNGNWTKAGYSTGPGNRLLSDGTWTYLYDNVGNTISKTNIATGQTWAFSWDNANHLTLAVNKDAQGNLIQSVSFKYDVFGQKVEENDYTQATGQTVTTKYAYDANGSIWADLNASNQVVMRRLFVDVNGQTQPFVRIDASGNVAWYLTDHLGSVRLLSDNTGAVIDQIDYDAYGNITNETNPMNGDSYKYASGQFQANLGMTFFGGDDGRWLNNGRWFRVDSIGLTAGPNSYEDVGNDPTNAIDPSGKAGLPFWVAPPRRLGNPAVVGKGGPTYVAKEDISKTNPNVELGDYSMNLYSGKHVLFPGSGVEAFVNFKGVMPGKCILIAAVGDAKFIQYKKFIVRYTEKGSSESKVYSGEFVAHGLKHPLSQQMLDVSGDAKSPSYVQKANGIAGGTIASPRSGGKISWMIDYPTSPLIALKSAYDDLVVKQKKSLESISSVGMFSTYAIKNGTAAYRIDWSVSVTWNAGEKLNLGDLAEKIHMRVIAHSDVWFEPPGELPGTRMPLPWVWASTARSDYDLLQKAGYKDPIWKNRP